MSSIKQIKLKGGSLNNTILFIEDNKKYVRKSVSLVKNREYGFQRWYSQLKRIQRYSVLFPDIFPKLLGYGMKKEFAFFDIEYVDESKNGFEFVSTCSDNDKIDKFFESIILTMNKMHGEKDYLMQSDDRSIELYLREEVFQRIEDSKSNSNFNAFLNYKEVVFQGHKIPGLIHQLDKYANIAKNHYKDQKECFTHGNLTLENTVYNQKFNKIYFIDPYEENIIDSKLAEYSQILQSCNSFYEIYNDGDAIVNDNNAMMDIDIPEGIKMFNKKFNIFLNDTLSKDELITVKIFEISQFIRMLPFKAVVDESKMIFFYCLASKLLNDLIEL